MQLSGFPTSWLWPCAWQARLSEHGVDCDLRRSEWGRLNFRDPDNIAVELVVVEPDEDVRNVSGTRSA